MSCVDPLGEVHRFYGESLEEALLVPLLALAIPICALAVARTLRRTRWGLLVPWVVARTAARSSNPPCHGAP